MPNPEPNHTSHNAVHGRPGDPCVFVIFGATGDLTKRLLIPSLYNLLANKLLPDKFAIVGVSNVQMHQSKPAVQAFQRILGAIEQGDVDVDDEARMRDLAYLSMARTFYSASVKLYDRGGRPTNSWHDRAARRPPPSPGHAAG